MSDISKQALNNATSNVSTKNYQAIFEGFIAKGIPENDIKPRENVFTWHAWQELGRVVNKHQHGVRITSWIPMTKKDKQGEKQDIGRKPKRTTVFHISQTSEV